MISSNIFLFLSTLSLRRATSGNNQYLCKAGISIHALLAESDHIIPIGVCVTAPISIHALLAESDAYGRINDISRLIFLSTLSLRRATLVIKNRTAFSVFLSTLSLRRATVARLTKFVSLTLFLSTLSLRRATYVLPVPRPPQINFYPRSPCGERLGAPVDRMPSSSISIHALLAESDAITIRGLVTPVISIHALLAESDLAVPDLGKGYIGFLSTLSLRRATQRDSALLACSPISIHALLAESD